MLIYQKILERRHARFDRNPSLVQKADVPTICVGNVTVGGTGKTPHTEMILRMLLGSDAWKGASIAVLSRGYKRRSEGFQVVQPDCDASFTGDEPLQIKRKFPEVTVVVDKDRVEGCELLAHPGTINIHKGTKHSVCRDWPAADIVVLDDAFQYRRLKADLDVVLVDYNRPVSNDRLLPFGHLRDLKERVYLADVIIVTKCPEGMYEEEKLSFLADMSLEDYDPSKGTALYRKNGAERTITVLFTTIRYGNGIPVLDAGNSRYSYSKNIFLFTGIADDTPLLNHLSGKYKIAGHQKFPDHHRYVPGDFASMISFVRNNPTSAVFTTEKDAQRVREVKRLPAELAERMIMVPIEAGFLSPVDREIFESILASMR